PSWYGSNEPSVVSFFAQHAIGGDQLFPFCVDIVGIKQEVEKPLQSLASPSIANCAEYPKPFTSRGRVATTHASIKLCLATHSLLPCLKRSFMALRACVEAGWGRSAARKMMFVSTRQSIPTTCLRDRRCFHG